MAVITIPVFAKKKKKMNKKPEVILNVFFSKFIGQIHICRSDKLTNLNKFVGQIHFLNLILKSVLNISFKLLFLV